MSLKRRADDSLQPSTSSTTFLNGTESVPNNADRFQKETFRFMLLGKTGSGKSSTGNTILGRDLFVAEASFVSTTADNQLRSADSQGAAIQVMDLPGLFDTKKTHEEVSTIVMEAVTCMHPGPDAILYVIKIGRYTEEELGVYNRLKALLDDNVTKYIIVVFTHGDELKGEDIKDILAKLSSAGLKQVMEECDHRYVVFDNMTSDKQPQVERLLETARKLRARNGHAPYTCPKNALVAEKMEEELARRLAVVEESELKRTNLVKELSQAEETARREKEEIVRKDLERQEAMERERQSMQTRVNDMSEALKQQEENKAEQRNQMVQLNEKLEREKRELQERMEQQQAEELRRREADMEKEKKRQQEEMEKAEEARERQERELEALRQEARHRRRRRKKDCSISKMRRQN